MHPPDAPLHPDSPDSPRPDSPGSGTSGSGASPAVEISSPFHRPTCAVVHLGYIQANLRAVQARVGTQRKVWAVVKANGYGHGMIPVAAACLEAGAYGLAVATADEAVQLRERFPAPPILVLGPTLPADAEALVAAGIEVAVGDMPVAQALSAAGVRLRTYARAQLKIDTGMGRFGFPSGEVSTGASQLTALPAFRWEGIFTHFSVSDSPTEDDTLYTLMQLEGLRRAAKTLLRSIEPKPGNLPMLHACNSGGILQHPDAFLDAVRPGVMLYGHLPDPRCAATVPLLPGMTLKTRIVHLREHLPGASLSYGRTYECDRKTRIGVLPVGYGDGYNRLLSNRGEVVVLGRRAPIRGRVCMDQTLVDVTEIPGAGIGTEVVLFGGPPGADGRPPLPVQEMAGWLNTITYEVTCQVGSRVPRIYER